MAAASQVVAGTFLPVKLASIGTARTVNVKVKAARPAVVYCRPQACKM